jgi:2-polyprenyl-3-methyl-5-hydroxy-6-metoxy-1,4-benzoquinol methylase
VVTFNPSRERLRQETAAFAASIPSGALVLDAGAGKSPYKSLFGHARYESADFGKVDTDYAPQTYTCDLTQIPVADGRFDAALLTQVLEHVPEPLAVLRELHRVLKPGALLMYSAPLFYEEHNKPYDFFRYTSFGIRYLLERADFELERLDWLEGYFGTLGYQFETAAKSLPRRSDDYGGGVIGALAVGGAFLLRSLCRRMSALFHRLEMRHKLTTTGYPKNYVAIARRR